jgi:hypothetical protein
MIKLFENEKFWIALLLLLLLPFIALSFFIHPSADDYILSAAVRDNGFIEHFKQVYFEWSGRYFATFLVSMNPLVFNWAFGYKLIPIMLFIIFYLAFYYLLDVFLSAKTDRINKHLFSLIAVLLFCEVIPSTAECIYWMSGSLTYFLPSILTMILLTLLLKITYFGESRKFIFASTLVLPFLICGSNEVNMIFLAGLLSSVLLYRLIAKKIIIKIFWLVWLCTIAASILLITAPGNYSRIETFSGQYDFLFAGNQAVVSFFKIALSFLKDPTFLISTMLFISVINYFRKSNVFLAIINVSPFYCIPFATVLLMTMYFFVSFSTGLKPALRIHNTVAFFFLPAWFYCMAVLHNYLLQKKQVVYIEVPKYLIILLSAAAYILTVTSFSKEPGKEIIAEGNIFRAGYDLVINAKTYNDELNAREESIRTIISENKKYIEVPVLSTIPQTIHFIDISDTTSNWINISTAKYFGLDSIKLKKNRP